MSCNNCTNCTCNQAATLSGFKELTVLYLTGEGEDRELHKETRKAELKDRGNGLVTARFRWKGRRISRRVIWPEENTRYVELW
jgi:hypothetical protein